MYWPISAKIVTTPGKDGLQIFMSNGEKMQPMFTLPYRRDPTSGVAATATLKEVVWTTSGKAACLIVNQALQEAYGLNVDQVITFDALHFFKKLGKPGK